MKKSVYRQLVVLFIGVMLCSNILSFLLSYNRSGNRLTVNIRESAQSMLESAQALYARGEDLESEIEQITENGSIRLEIVNSLSEFSLTPAQEEGLLGGSLVYLQSKQSKGSDGIFSFAVARMGERYAVLSMASDQVTLHARLSAMQIVLIALLLGSVAFLVVGRMILSPVKELTLATKKVAGGDFDVYIRHNRKDEMGTLIDNFNKMTAGLRSTEILRSDFISDISHEIKTPITSIEGYARLLADESLTDAERREYVEIITSETARLSAMSSNILTLNRLENDASSMARAEFRFDELVRRVVLLIENRWAAKNLEINVQLARVVFYGNEHLLHQVVLNLVDNAVKFSPVGGRVDIGLSETETGVVLSVGDRGPGIEAEDQARVFDKFFKADRSRSGEGNGLGLSIVQKITQMHGGEIEIRSRKGEGTAFYVFLPHGVQ